MTSSSKHLKPGEPRWDSSKHEFKSHDPFCEPGLISLLFLAHGNHEITKRCLQSTTDAVASYNGELEFCFIENGEDDKNWKLFEDYKCDRKKLIRSTNWGIMAGLNDLFSISRGEYCLILENDFWNSRPEFNFLQVSKDILDEQPEVGLVHLRDVSDPFENWGFGKKEFLPFSFQECEGMYDAITSSGYRYKIADYPNKYNNNPVLIRKELWRRCGHFNEPVLGTCPKHDESHYQVRVNKTEYKAANVMAGLYRHVGGAMKDIFLERQVQNDRT